MGRLKCSACIISNLKMTSYLLHGRFGHQSCKTHSAVVVEKLSVHWPDINVLLYIVILIPKRNAKVLNGKRNEDC